MFRFRAAVLAVALGLTPAGWAGPRPAAPVAPVGFVMLRAVAPDIEEEIRYASPENFTGAVVDGYREPLCLLTEDAARALRSAQQWVLRQGYTLRVYDCYRPQRAVDHFVRWTAAPDDPVARQAHYPRVPKNRLIADGYLAEQSGHSRGSTVDVTLVRLPGGPGAEPLDMGTPFDFFDPRSHPAHPGIDARQRAARELLRSALGQAGFAPLETEWWHFGLRDEPFPGTAFDFPVARASLRAIR